MKPRCPYCESLNWIHDKFDIGRCKDCGKTWDLTGFPMGGTNPMRDVYD